MFVPYATDAPIYHWPYATLSTIVLNTVIFLPMLGMDFEQMEKVYGPFVLHFGGLYPWQWVTSHYVHGGILHLVANMIVLWAFGIIVEGKLGWWKFLLLYNGIGILFGAIEQTATLGFTEGGAYGASAIIYGLIAIALVWSPSNELTCFYWFGFWVAGTVDVAIVTFASVSFAIQGLMATIAVMLAENMASAITSEALHLLGAAVGFGFGVFMLKAKLVDCENWDMFSVWKGRQFLTREELAREALESPEGQAKIAQQREATLAQFRRYLADGEAAAALVVSRRAHTQFPAWQLSEAEYVQLIASLRKAQLWNDAVICMNEYLRLYTERAAMVRLALAQTLAEHLGRPAQAMKVMANINPAQLDAPRQQMLQTLRAKATAATEDDPYEVVTDEF